MWTFFLLSDATEADAAASPVASFATDLPFFDTFLFFLPEPSLLYLAKYSHKAFQWHMTNISK